MIGQTLAHYRILEKLGAGGMGEVYRAHDEQLERDVAIKVLPPGTFSDPAGRARLLQEARAAAALNHPHVCTIHEVGEAGGQVYIAMELIAGQPLDRVIPTNGFQIDQALRYGLQIADAVAHAHDRGVVHRDLKSANVVVTPQGRAKVLDFGLAKRATGQELTDATSLTQPGALIGTLAYMAPEQLRGGGADARSDVWALGVMLYEMATGARPFQARSGFELSSAIVNQPPAPLPGTVSVGLAAVIGRCLEKTPERRYQRASEVHAALESIQAGVTPRLIAEHRPHQRKSLVLRRPWVVTAVALAAAAVFGLGWWTLMQPPAPITHIDSLVVLPLDNLSRDPEQDYFVEGMHEAIIGELARIGSVRVISRTSAMRYTGTDKSIPAIGKELNVAGVVEGSVLRAGGRVRIALQLIDGAADRHLWADTYERDLTDVLTLQAEVARAVARQIAVALSPADRERSEATTRPGNTHHPQPDAYDAYLKGRYHYARWGGSEPLATAIRYYEEAIAKDPAFAQGHAALAMALRGMRSGASPEQRERARWAARRAIELDPTLAEGHTALGVALMQDWEWEHSDQAFQRAIQLDPNSSAAYQWYAELLRRYPARRHDALKAARKAAELDPLSLSVKTMVGWVLYYDGRFDEAIKAWDAVLELDPNYGLAIYNQGLAYAQKGLGEETIRAAQRAAPLYADGPEGTTMLLGIGYALSGQRDLAKAVLRRLERPGPKAILYFVLGDEEHALMWLERGYDLRGMGLPAITSECGPVWFADLCDHPRFRALRAKMGLP